MERGFAMLSKKYPPMCELSIGRIGNGRVVDEGAALAALEWAILDDADVINASWSFDVQTCSDEMPCPICRFCHTAHQRNICIVAAAGNVSGGDDKITTCPAKNRDVVTVGSVDLGSVDTRKKL